MPRTCSKCGVALDAGQSFCSRCGAVWNASAPVAASGPLKPILIAVGILLVAGMGAGGWLYARNHDRPVPAVEAKQAKGVTGGALPAPATRPQK